METTTRTQLQTHFSRLLDLASQPSPPLKPTFWDKLDLNGRQASVDQNRSWKFDNESAWDPIGAVRDEWNKSIYPGAIKPLLQDNTRMVYKNVKRQTPYSVCCWMIGKEWHSSRPAAIIICGNKRVTKNTVKLIEGHGELARTWGFRVYGYESKISITMGTSANDIDNNFPLCAISGTRFAVGGRDGISTRTATLGGSIVIDGEYFGVTVVHPFMNFPQDGSSDEDESDMSDDSSEMTDIISHTEEAPYITLESDAAFVEEPRSHRREMLGAIPDSNRPKYFSRGTDWALLKLRPAAITINLVTAGGKLVVPWSITRDSLSKGDLWAAVSPANPVQTKVSPSICGLFIPHVGLQDVWALNMKPIPGYCGSWVMDVSSNAISGILVAGSEANNASYALPAHVVFDEIRAHFPTMRLQSLELIAELPVSAFVEVIRTAEELGLSQFVTEMVWRRRVVEERDYTEWTSLCWAILEGYEAAVASLLEAGASPHFAGKAYNMLPLTLAAQKGHVAIVKLLLSAGADPNSQSGNDSNTPLAKAAQYDREEVISILIARGADINKTFPPRGRTPLMEAVSSNQENAARVLLEKGADVNCVDVDGNTPLLLAAVSYNPAIVNLLIASGADINKKGIRGKTPLMKAVLSENEGSVRVLLEKGADVNCVDVDGKTPLLWAAELKSSAIVKLLIERGALVNLGDNDGDTPLMRAVNPYNRRKDAPETTRNDEIVNTLLEHGANPDAQNKQGNTPLLIAITSRLGTPVKIPLDYHASMDIPNSRGETPRSLAQQNPKIARILYLDPASLDDELGSVCPPAPTNSPVIGPLEQPLPLESLPLGEPAEEMRGKDKRKQGDGMLDMDRIMAQLGTRFISEPSEATWTQKEKKKSKGSKSDIYDPNAHLDAEYTRGFLYHKT